MDTDWNNLRRGRDLTNSDVGCVVHEARDTRQLIRFSEVRNAKVGVSQQQEEEEERQQ